MKVGYARVSREEQHLELQLDALKAIGCEQLFTEKIKSVKDQRPQLEQALQFVRAGDTFVVWRLDQIGRSLKNLLEIMAGLETRGVEFQSLTEHLDTSSPSGKLIFHIFGSVAEFERALTIERTHAGLAAARARGRKGGRPRGKAFSTPEKIKTAQALYDQGTPIKQICELLHCGPTTLYRYIKTKQPDRTQAAEG
jgi:DNA invertase Pin-like site-specific DNA recombinase